MRKQWLWMLVALNLHNLLLLLHLQLLQSRLPRVLLLVKPLKRILSLLRILMPSYPLRLKRVLLSQFLLLSGHQLDPVPLYLVALVVKSGVDIL